jgi:hypothetical protein
MRIQMVFLASTAASLLIAFLMGFAARSTVSSIKELFKMDKVTGMASVELWVVLTTVMLVLRFFLDFHGPWYTNTSVNHFIVGIEVVNYTMVHYTMGLMQLSAAKVNDYFQVWAVLLVTLQYSVKTGRPYSRSKQIPLLDLMSSFWAANLIRMQTFLHLRISLWLIWAVNAARIISYFSSSDKAEAINQESTKLVADYMSYEHEFSSPQLSADAANPSKEFTMKWYKYLVLGEDQALKNLQERLCPGAELQPELAQRRKRGIWLDPNDNEKLVTIDKIWDVSASESGLLGSVTDQTMLQNERPRTSIIGRFFATCHADQLRDVCLSFSLYKQLRRQFYDLRIHEVRLPTQMKKMKRLVFQYILNDAERAFHVTAAELSFLQDLFYSKRAAIFATGFPATNLALSVLLIAATSYIAYPIRYIPGRMDLSDRNRITHGVFFTRIVIVFIVYKELAEIYMYVFSQWTKVLILCNYTKRRCLQHPLVETAMRVMLYFIRRDDYWNEVICQHNLLIPYAAVRIGGLIIILKREGAIRMGVCTKEAIFTALKKLENESESKRLDSYLSKAFGEPEELLQGQLLQDVLGLEADTHRILVWHIATSLCEIKLASEKASVLRPWGLRSMPVVKKPKEARSSRHLQASGNIDEVEAGDMWWKNYMTAASLSNYCAYLVTQALVPDSGLITSKVIQEVCEEIRHVTMNDGIIRSLLRRRSMQDVFDRLMATIGDAEEEEQGNPQRDPDIEAPLEVNHPQGRGDDRDIIKNSLTRMGARLATQLMLKYSNDKAGLWENLAVFWTGFLLHLAASTRASKHKTCLAGRQELATHLWALLSHAGLLEGAEHGEELLDPEELDHANPLDG